MIEPKFAIGQRVFLGEPGERTVVDPCAECGGTGEWTVKTAQGEFQVSCGTCCIPWHPEGRLPRIELYPVVRTLTIGQIQIRYGGGTTEVRYMCEETGIGSGTLWDEHRLSETREGADRLAKLACAERRKWLDEQEAKREAEGRKTAHWPSRRKVKK